MLQLGWNLTCPNLCVCSLTWDIFQSIRPFNWRSATFLLRCNMLRNTIFWNISFITFDIHLHLSRCHMCSKLHHLFLHSSRSLANIRSKLNQGLVRVYLEIKAFFDSLLTWCLKNHRIVRLWLFFQHFVIESLCIRTDNRMKLRSDDCHWRGEICLNSDGANSVINTAAHTQPYSFTPTLVIAKNVSIAAIVPCSFG